MQRSLKRNLAIGGAALVVAGGAGGAYAATQSSGPSSRQAFLNDVAKRLHVTPQQLSSALNGAFSDQLQAAVRSGRLTQAEANALEQRLKQKGAVPGVPFGFGPHVARPWLRGGGPGLGPLGRPGGLEGAAGYLGISDQQLFQDLASGKSLAQIAASRGKTVSGLEQAMTAEMKARLDKLVAGKMITSAQEQKILRRWSARLSAQVNQKGPPFGHRAFRFHQQVPMPPNVPAPGGGFKLPYPAPTA